MAFIRRGVGQGSPNDPADVRVVQQLLLMNRMDLDGLSLGNGLPIRVTGSLDTQTLSGLEQVRARAGLFGLVRVAPEDPAYFQLIRETLTRPGSVPADDLDPLLQLSCTDAPFQQFRALVALRRPNTLVDILIEMTRGRGRNVTNSKHGSAQAIADAVQLAIDLAQADTPQRQSAFLAQTAVESDGYYTTREYASGAEYENRVKDLGNVREGDGVRFAGRGFIQLTGRDNYTKCWQDLGRPLADDPTLPLKKDPLHPEWAEGLDGAARTTAWYWKTHHLNKYADALVGNDEEDEFLKLSIAINGKNKKTGLPNGWDDRKDFYRVAKKLINLKYERLQ